MEPAKAPGGVGRSLALAVVIAALVGGVSGFGAGYLNRPAPSPTPLPQTREIYLLPMELDFNATVAGIPHYVFVPDLIQVNKGDTVTIHFYDTTDEGHTFTMGAPYATDVVLGPATATAVERRDITFVATTPGTFLYHCRFHSPTMAGYLVVVG